MNDLYTLTDPCKKCPFRNDNPTYLRDDRAADIADTLRNGGTFHCHQTVNYDDTDTDDTDADDCGDSGTITSRTRACAGALITMEKEGITTQHARISERLGLRNPETLNMNAPVHGSLTEWVRAHRPPVPTVTVDGETLEYEHCGVVGQNCVNPPGYGNGGAMWENDDEPQCHPIDDVCDECGSTMCEECRSGSSLCVHCSGDED